MKQKFNNNKQISEPVVLGPEVSEIPPKTRKLIASAQQYIGSIPPAEEFAKYGQVLENAPERIMAVFEQDSVHTRQMQANSLIAEISRDKRSQWMALFSIFGSLAVTAYSLYLGKDIAAALAALAALASLFLVFKGAFSKPNQPQSNNSAQ